MSRVQAPAVRRAQIVEAAKERFRDAGFHATTMADIAASAGVSVGLLYRYFPSKEEVIRDIVEADLKDQLLAVQGALAAHPADDAAALEALIANLTDLAIDKDRTRLILEIAAETARSPALFALADETEQRVRTLIDGRFCRGLPAPESDIRIRMMLSLFSGLGIEVYRDPSRRDVAVRLTTEAVRRVLYPGADRA